MASNTLSVSTQARSSEGRRGATHKTSTFPMVAGSPNKGTRYFLHGQPFDEGLALSRGFAPVSFKYPQQLYNPSFVLVTVLFFYIFFRDAASDQPFLRMYCKGFPTVTLNEKPPNSKPASLLSRRRTSKNDFGMRNCRQREGLIFNAIGRLLLDRVSAASYHCYSSILYGLVQEQGINVEPQLMSTDVGRDPP